MNDQTKRNRFVDRPRLTTLLDDAASKTILLIAPAGYGKTTLAEEWLTRRRHGWVRLTNSQNDVAALALSIADAGDAVQRGVSEKVAEALRRFSDPASNATVVARHVAAALAGWPEDAWIVLDDYHVVAGSGRDVLVNHLVTDSRVNLLVCSRERPKWATARRLLYGEIYEVGQARLAMTEEEAVKVLGEPMNAAAGGLVSLADGWPAVIGLAAAAGAVSFSPDSLPDSLYRYFAEELLQKVTPAARPAFVVLASTPTINDGVVAAVAGVTGSGEEVIEEGVRVGLLFERSNRSLEMNPLVRAFLEREAVEIRSDLRSVALTSAFDFYIAERSWDECSALLRTAGLPQLIPRLIEVALDEMLALGRIETLSAWSDFARAKGVRHPLLDLADAEVAFRRGLHRQAEPLALEAARCIDASDPLHAHAYLRAGQAAYFNDRHSEALEDFEAARNASRAPTVVREANWGSFIAAIDLERVDDAADFLEACEDLPDKTVDDVVRLATGRLAYGHRRHGLIDAVENARHVAELGNRVRSPMIATAFWNGYAGALMMSAEYELSIEMAKRGVAEAEANALHFVLPHAHLVMAQSHLGLRNVLAAGRLIDQMAADGESRNDPFFAANASTLRARLEIANSKPEDALAATQTLDARVRSRATRGERHAVRSLAFLMTGQIERAATAIHKAREATTTAATDALTTLVSTSDPALRKQFQISTRKAVSAVATSGHFDMLVLAYRARPELLPTVAEVMGPDDAARLLVTARDDALGVRAGILAEPSERLAATSLSRREREVSRLLAQGRTNAEIGAALFISEVTVKVHVRHILAKLGVRNRAEAAVLVANQLHSDS